MTDVKHIILPAHVKESWIPCEGETIAVFAERVGVDFRLPTICVVNGQPVLRSEWAVTPVEGEVVFLSKPHGSGGSHNKTTQIVALVAVVALAVAAPWAAGILTGATSGLLFSAVAAGITVGGGLLLSTFLKPSTADTTSDTQQIYSLSGTANTARPFQPIPVQYGTLKSFPDYASIPYSDYEGNDQYLCALYMVGLGKYRLDEIFLEDTPIWNPTDGVNPAYTLTLQYVQPGEVVTLFPANVVTSTEINNIQLPDPPGGVTGGAKTSHESDPGDWIGPFIINQPGTLATSLAFDFVLPSGLYAEGSNGQVQPQGVVVQVQIRQVDDSGTPIGSWSDAVYENIILATKQPTRFSRRVTVAEGRWETQIRRFGYSLDAPFFNMVAVETVRAFLKGVVSFADATILAVRIKSTAQLTSGSSRKLAIKSTRILPCWNGTNFVDNPTRNPVYAFLDMAHNSLYGANRPLSKIDIQTILSTATGAEVRGDTFNFIFNSTTTFPEAFDKALLTTRAKHTWSGDILTLVRDEFHPIPQMLLSDQQIVRGSLSVDYIFNDEDQSDCVIGQFLNENTWQPASIQYPPNSDSFTGVKPSIISMDGFTNPAHVQREVAFMYRQALLRRQKVTFNTEHDGRILKYGSSIKVQSYLPAKWGQSAEVLSYNPTTHVIAASHDIEQLSGQNYVEFRGKTGSYFGPVKIDGISSGNLITINSTDLALIESQLSTTLVDVLDRMDGAEPPIVVAGNGQDLSRQVIVLAATPNGDQVTLSCVQDDIEVHNDDITDPPPFPEAPGTADSNNLTISGLNAHYLQGMLEPILAASWLPTPKAVYYRAWVSYDVGHTWSQIYEGSDNSFALVIIKGAIRLRVAAFSADKQGPFAYVDLADPDVALAPGSVTVDSFNAGLKDLVTNIFVQSMLNNDKVRQLVASVAADADAQNVLTNIEARKNIIASEGRVTTITTGISDALGDTNAAVEAVSTIATSTQGAFASFSTSVTAHFATNDAAILTNSNAIVTAQGSIATLSSSVTASFATTNANVTANSTAIANNLAAFTSYSTTTTASINGLTSSVSTVSTAVSGINGRLAATHGVYLDVNGYASGFEQLNDGTFSSFTIIANQFSVVQPGVSGGSVVPVFVITPVSGTNKIAFRGDMIGDGDITARSMHAASITAINAALDTLAVKSLNLGDNAVTVPAIQTTGAPVTGNNTFIDPVSSIDVFIDTTGLSGKTMFLQAIWIGKQAYTGSGIFDVRLNIQQAGFSDTQVDSVASSATQVAVPMIGGLLFTADGTSSMHFYIHIKWAGDPTITLTSRTLTVQVGKR